MVPFPPMRRASAPRLPTVVLILALTAAAAATLAVGWAALGAGGAEPTVGTVPLTDRGIKGDLLAHLDAAPETLIFGGSRATRFEPSYLESLTGVTGFNLALQNGRPEDAWAFTAYVRRLFPGARPRILWFVHVESFREQPLSPGLTEDHRFARAFPRALILGARATPYPVDAATRARDLGATSFGPDGVVLRNRYDSRSEKGYRLTRGVDWSIAKYRERYENPTPTLDPRAQLYFEKTVALANRLGRIPVIVLMPSHPRLLAAIRAMGWQRQHDEVVEYLDSLMPRLRLRIVDLSELSSVPGASRDAFYDGIHVRRSNAERILDEVVRLAGDELR